MDRASGPGASLQTDWPQEPAGPPPPKDSPFALLKELPVLILIAFGLALLIKTFLIQAFYIPSESMVDTLLVKDRVLVNRLVYRFREPQRGEIIVFVAERDTTPKTFWKRASDFLTEGLGVQTPSERDFIKRVIGLPGETLTYRNGVVTITKPDGSRLQLKEPYARKDTTAFGPRKVPAGHYFVMGDNRPNSSDSRSQLGEIKREDIIGKAFIRIWPPRRLHVFDTPEYGTFSKPKPKAKSSPAKKKSGALPADLAPVLIAAAAVRPNAAGGDRAHRVPLPAHRVPLPARRRRGA